jgi:asparagine synthase (glutamine-hydrolysing)
MCGIVGLIGPQEDGWIEAMNNCIVRRGPDDSGIHRDREANLAIAIRRLAIMDLAGGHQPMVTPDGRYAIVYNGEVYNAAALRAGLEARGVRFQTDHSDTEAVLQLLIHDGVDALPRLSGMFAFAFYDRDKGRVICARDRFGIKPLYYAQAGGRLALASEMKALLALPFIPREVNRAALFHYMSLMYLPETDSILTGIKRLPAGCAMTYDIRAGDLRIQRFWQPQFTPDESVPEREWPERLLASFREAVGRWHLADVPVGASLSGGLDSSGIVGALAQAGVRMKTYSVGFTGEGEKSWNELPRARLVAQHWSSDHHEIELTPDALLQDLVQMVWALDEPYGGGLPSWSVFQFMARDVKVGHTGTGGDELFGNYGKWDGLERNWIGRDLDHAVDQDRFRTRFFERYYYFSDSDKRAVMTGMDDCPDTSSLLYGRFAGSNGPVRDRAAITDITTQLAEEFLPMTDRFSMAHSLEARTPFLDNDFAALAMSVPARLRTHPRDLKGLLRRTLSPVLVPEVEKLPKMGFVIPLKLWLRGRLRPHVEMLLAPQRLAAQGYFSPDFYARYVRPHIQGQADHTNKVWAALMFQLWHMVFIERGTPDFDLAALAQ